MALTAPDPFLAARRAFPSTQTLLAGIDLAIDPDIQTVGWHGTAFHPENGSVALVSATFVRLVGETLRVSVGNRTVYVYVIGVRNLRYDLSLARRPFMALGGLYNTSLPCVAARTP